MSRASSMENVKTSVTVDNQHRNNKQLCMWNLDFTPYNSPLIRMKYDHLTDQYLIILIVFL